MRKGLVLPFLFLMKNRSQIKNSLHWWIKECQVSEGKLSPMGNLITLSIQWRIVSTWILEAHPSYTDGISTSISYRFKLFLSCNWGQDRLGSRNPLTKIPGDKYVQFKSKVTAWVGSICQQKFWERIHIIGYCLQLTSGHVWLTVFF